MGAVEGGVGAMGFQEQQHVVVRCSAAPRASRVLLQWFSRV